MQKVVIALVLLFCSNSLGSSKQEIYYDSCLKSYLEINKGASPSDAKNRCKWAVNEETKKGDVIWTNMNSAEYAGCEGAAYLTYPNPSDKFGMAMVTTAKFCRQYLKFR